MKKLISSYEGKDNKTRVGETLDLPSYAELDEMSAEDKAKLTGQAKAKANLIPAKKGEVRNPSGKNQYTLQKALSTYQAECAIAALADIDDLREVAATALYSIVLNGKKEETRLRAIELIYKLLIPAPTQKHSNADGSNLSTGINAVFFVPSAEIIPQNIESREEIETIPAQIVEIPENNDETQ